MRLLAEILVGVGLLILLGVAVRVTVRRYKDGTGKVQDQVDAEAPRNVDRGHARSEAEAAKDTPLSPAEAAEVAEFEAFFEEIGSGEFPTFAFAADPLGEPIPDGYVMEPESFFHDLASARLSAFTWTAAQRSTVALSSVQVVEPAPPEPFALEGPTGVFPSNWMEQAMAGGAR